MMSFAVLLTFSGSFCLAVAAAELTPMDWHEGDLVVPRGSSCTVSGTGKTNSTLTVSGELTVDMATSGGSYYYIAKNTSDKWANSGVYVAPNPGDDALVYIKKGRMWGRVGNAMYTSLYFGGTNSADAAGYGRLVLAPGDAGDEEFSSIYFQQGFQPKSPDDESIEAIVLDRQTVLISYSLVQRNPKPVQVTFTNSLGEAGNVAGPILRGFYNGSMFYLQSGADIVLKGYGYWGGGKSDGICAPIRLGTHGGNTASTVFKRFFDAKLAASNLKGCVRTEGNCDVVLEVGATGSGEKHVCHYLNATNVIWNHTGKTVIPSAGNYDIGLGVTVDNALPYGSQTGILQIDSYAQYDGKSFVDLFGTTQRLNGLRLTGGSCVHNADSNVVASLVFGSNGEDSGIHCAGTIDTNVLVRKVGAGTLTISNMTALCQLAVEAGTLCVQGSGGARIESPRLALAAGATLVVDGVTLVVPAEGAEIDASATVVSRNGGAFVAESSDDGRTVHIASAAKYVPHLRVTGGTYAFSGLGTTNHWFKWTYQQMKNNGKFELCGLLLLDAANQRTDGGGSQIKLPASDIGYDSRSGWGNGSPVTNAEPAIVTVSDGGYDARRQNPKSIWAETQGWQVTEDESYRKRSPSALFDPNTWSKLQYGDVVMSLSTPSTWKRFIVRLATTAKRTYSYTMMHGYSNNACPSDWVLETSPDGLTWQTVDVKNNAVIPTTTAGWYNDGVPYPINTGDMPDAGGLAAESLVQVDAGATLDCSLVNGGQELTALAVDLSAGGGTLKNVRLAQTGTLKIVNALSGRFTGELPLTFVDSPTTGSLDWPVVVNGKTTRSRLVWQNGKLTVNGPGLIMIVR